MKMKKIVLNNEDLPQFSFAERLKTMNWAKSVIIHHQLNPQTFVSEAIFLNKMS